MKRSLLLVMLLCLACSVVFAQATRPRSSRIVTGTAFPYGTCEVGDEWVDTSISPAQTRNCLTAGTWSTVAVLSPDGSSSNTINGSAQTVQIALSQYRGVGVVITGTWTGTLVVENSLDGGSAWIATQFYDPSAKTFSSSTTGNLTASIVVSGGVSHVRIRSSAWTSGTATITLRATEASTPVIDGSLNTQPISAASLPLPSGAATAANQTNGNQKVRITDSFGNSISADSSSLNVNLKTINGTTINEATNGVQKVGIVGHDGTVVDAAIGVGTAPPNQVVTGGVYNSTKPTLTNGQSVAVQVDTNGNQLGVVRDAAGNDRGANVNASNQLSVSVDNSPTVTANAGTNLNTSALATSAKQSDGSQKSQLVDSSGNVVGSTGNALDINIKSGNPTTITATQATASSLNAQVVGAAASGASKVGNPVQTGGVFNTTQPTVTNGQAVENQATARGAQIVATGVDTFNVSVNAALPAGSNVIGHVVNDSGSTTAVTGNVTVVQPTGSSLHTVLDANSGVDIGKLSANQSVNVSQVAGTATDTNSGNKSNGTLRVVLATDQPALTNKLLVTPDANSAVNVAQINGATVNTGNGTASGSQRVTIASDSTGTVAATQSGTWTVQPGNTANTTAWLVQPVPGTANGASTCVVQSAASTNATNCKNAAGLIYGLEVVNTTSTIYYLRLYNLSTSPTCSSATGFIRTVPIPHASGAGAGIANFYTVGETYGTGIGFCLTAGGSSTDNSSAAVGVFITIHYK
jgi:hypothetical protein